MKSLQRLESQCLPGSIHWQQVFDMDEQIEVRIARLESDVGHIQRDVADIKVELRRTNDKIDAMDEKLTAKIDGVEQKLTAKIDGVEQKLTAKIDDVEQKLTVKIDGVEQKLTVKIDGVEQKLVAKIDGLEEKLNAMKVWAMGMYFALAGSLLLVMAKGFKWI